jgi:hypothetical protein
MTAAKKRTPGNRFLLYEESRTAPRTRSWPVAYNLSLHSGEQVFIRWGFASEYRLHRIGGPYGRLNLPPRSVNQARKRATRKARMAYIGFPPSTARTPAMAKQPAATARSTPIVDMS